MLQLLPALLLIVFQGPALAKGDLDPSSSRSFVAPAAGGEGRGALLSGPARRALIGLLGLSVGSPWRDEPVPGWCWEVDLWREPAPLGEGDAPSEERGGPIGGQVSRAAPQEGFFAGRRFRDGP